MQAKIKFEFSAQVWQHHAPGGWFFVSLPQLISQEIREQLRWQEEGWGRLKATAVVGRVEWDTAIWYDKKRETYLLPLKSEVRKKGDIKLEQTVAVSIFV